MKNILIAFSGKGQSGKTTSCNILKELILDIQHEELKNNPNIEAVSRDGDSFNVIEHGVAYKGYALWISNAQIYSFASALKEIAEKYFDWDSKDKGIYYEDTTDTGSMDIHEDGQTPSVGRMPIKDRGRQLLINIGQSFRAIRPTIWVDIVVNKINKLNEMHTDQGIVFLNDDTRFPNEVILLKTFDPCFTVRISRPEEIHIDDTSETALDNTAFDYYIQNNGDKEELKNELKKMYEDIISKI